MSHGNAFTKEKYKKRDKSSQKIDFNQLDSMTTCEKVWFVAFGCGIGLILRKKRLYRKAKELASIWPLFRQNSFYFNKIFSNAVHEEKSVRPMRLLFKFTVVLGIKITTLLPTFRIKSASSKNKEFLFKCCLI